MKYEYTATVLKVVDGDTVDLLVDVGFRHFMEDRFRLYGIDAWETRGSEREKGLEVKSILMDLILKKEVIVKTYKDQRGKYGRWLAEIWLGDRNINQWLVKKGYAKLYPF